MHLTPNGFVEIRFKMLTYFFVYAPLSNQIDASPFGVSCYFLDRFAILFQKFKALSSETIRIPFRTCLTGMLLYKRRYAENEPKATKVP
jgi:hypothetical protein